MCDAKIDKTALFSHILEKHPFSCFGPMLPPPPPPIRVYARIRARLEKKHPFIRVFLFTHGYQSRTRVAPPPRDATMDGRS